MAQIVYLLCALTSIGCAALLMRSYLRNRSRLLLWSAIAFIFFALNNILLFVDLVLVPNVDLSILRNAAVVAGILTLLYGLIWEEA